MANIYGGAETSIIITVTGTHGHKDRNTSPYIAILILSFNCSRLGIIVGVLSHLGASTPISVINFFFYRTLNVALVLVLVLKLSFSPYNIAITIKTAATMAL